MGKHTIVRITIVQIKQNVQHYLGSTVSVFFFKEVMCQIGHDQWHKYKTLDFS